MSQVMRRSLAGLLLIDPYDDFIAWGGEVSDRLKGLARRSASRMSAEHVRRPQTPARQDLLAGHSRPHNATSSRSVQPELKKIRSSSLVSRNSKMTEQRTLQGIG
jgi:hypothetical protein